MIKLQLKGELGHRNVAVRMVSGACKLMFRHAPATPEEMEAFQDEIVSAFGEAFNNIALHAYKHRGAMPIRIEIAVGEDDLTIRLEDNGDSYDPTQVAQPHLDELPESGLGLFIIRSFVDQVQYQPGPPNVLELIKRRKQTAR